MTAELLVQAPVISGTESGAVHAFGAARHAVFQGQDHRSKHQNVRQSFDPDHGRRRHAVRRRRLQWAHGKRGRRLPPFGDRSRDTKELKALVFTPNAFSATTTLTLTDTSRGMSASDATTTVTVTNGAPVYSVSTFLANQTTLDQTPGGFDILDSAANITANLDRLNGNSNDRHDCDFGQRQCRRIGSATDDRQDGDRRAAERQPFPRAARNH